MNACRDKKPQYPVMQIFKKQEFSKFMKAGVHHHSVYASRQASRSLAHSKKQMLYLCVFYT